MVASRLQRDTPPPSHLQDSMDWAELQGLLEQTLSSISFQSQRIPGSSIILRYIRSSYQNDPIRSAIELFLFLFAVRYLLAPKYSVKKHKGYVELTEDVRWPNPKRDWAS